MRRFSKIFLSTCLISSLEFNILRKTGKSSTCVSVHQQGTVNNSGLRQRSSAVSNDNIGRLDYLSVPLVNKDSDV